MVDRLFHEFDCRECREVNHKITQGFEQLTDDDFSAQTHHFNGRYENLYIQPGKIEGLDVVIQSALEKAAGILDLDRSELVYGFWMNAMGPGHVTTAHTHDDNDELLSAVYYVDVPENSGDLILTSGDKRQVILPRQGNFIFFSPTILHEVTENKSKGLRLSIAFNFGQSQVD